MTQQTFDPFFRRLFILLAMAGFFYALYRMVPIILLFFSAFILAYLFNPLVEKLARFMKRWIAILIVYVVITSGMVVLLWWLVPTLWQQLQSAWGYLPKLVTWYNLDARTWVMSHTRIRLPVLQFQGLSETMVGYLQQNYNVQDMQSLFRRLFSSSMSVLNNAGLVVLLPILMFYFLLNWQERLQVWRSALPRAYAPKIMQIVGDCDHALMSFVKGQLLVMLLLGVIYAVQLQLLGLDLGLIIGMSAGVASFVPYLGFGLGFVSAIIAGLFQFGLDWLHLGLIVGAFLIGQAIEGYVLQPLLLGEKIGLSPLWVMFSVLAGAAAFGFVGMLIALPVSAILNVLFRHVFEAYKDSDFYKGV